MVCLVLAERNRRQNARYSSISEDDLPASISSCVMSNSSRDKLLGKYDTTWVLECLCRKRWVFNGATFRFDGQADGAAGTSGEFTGYYGRTESAFASDDDMQLLRHFVFLIIIVCSFIVVSIILETTSNCRIDCEHYRGNLFAEPRLIIMGSSQRCAIGTIRGNALLRDNL